jgi:hypothetical protein
MVNTATPTLPMTRPDYSGHGIANVMASIQAALGRDTQAHALPTCAALCGDQLRDARHVVLLVVDGMGARQLAAHAPGGLLSGARVAELTSVFPSTTASAVTTFLTGDAPITHGLTGWHLWFEELAVVGSPLPFRVRGADVALGRLGVSAAQLFGTRSLSSRLIRRSVLIHPSHLCGTPYTEAHRGEAEVRPFVNLQGLCEAIVALGHEAAPSYCYAYWPELDSLSHAFGSASENAAGHLRLIDQMLAVCVERLRGTGTLLLVCADHGFVDTRPETRLALASLPQLARTLAIPLCGEPRMAFCYVRAGAERDFEGAVAETLGDAARVVTSGDLMAGGWLGPGPVHPRVERRIGTHILFMQGAYCITDRVAGETRPFKQVGVHGGMDDAELRVPLCTFPCS